MKPQVLTISRGFTATHNESKVRNYTEKENILKEISHTAELLPSVLLSSQVSFIFIYVPFSSCSSKSSSVPFLYFLLIHLPSTSLCYCFFSPPFILPFYSTHHPISLPFLYSSLVLFIPINPTPSAPNFLIHYMALNSFL